MAKTTCALGFVAQTGRAVVVALEPGPHMLAKWGLQLTPPGQERFVFHAAQEMDAAEASRWVSRSTAAITKHTRTEIDAVLDSLAGEVTHAAIVGRSLDLDQPLERILASHTLLHTAEGVLYRNAIADALREHGIVATLVAPETLNEERESLAQYGKVEAPWRREHKDATLAAQVVLRTGRAGVSAGASRTRTATSRRRRS
jgi:hypothetical protein